MSQKHESPPTPVDNGQVHRTPLRTFEQRVMPWLHGADSLMYALVSIVFLLAAFGMLGYTVWSFKGHAESDGIPLAIIVLVNDLLLVMIILEVLRTVLSYLEERGSSLQPFLFIAAISATRRILAIGAQMSVSGDQLTAAKFQESMIDLGVNAGAILVISVALYLLGKARKTEL